jgi:BrxA
MRYKADITAGSLKVPESRIISDLLLRRIDQGEWKQVILKENVLQTRNPATAMRLTRLIRNRLELMDSGLWKLVRDGSSIIATHSCLAAAIKHSALLGDFLDLVVREQYRTFSSSLSNQLWADYLAGCRGRDPDMPNWNESTQNRLRSSVFQMLGQAGFIEDTKSRKLHPAHIAPEVIRYLHEHGEEYVLRCIQVTR